MKSLTNEIMSNVENAVELKNVCKTYIDFELNDINFKLPKGYVMGFIGENGAGKTTTIKAMLGLVNIDGGSIFLLGEDMSMPMKDRRKKRIMEHIGVVMDDAGFPEDSNIYDIEKIMKSCYATWDSARFNEYLDKFKLTRKKKIKEYSKGMKMKLKIAAALSHDCRFLILDEATSGLDPVARNEVLDIFRDFIQNEECSVFISSHILSDLEKICDYITFICRGRIVFSESKDRLIEKYGLLRCSREDFESIDKEAVISSKVSAFNVEALVEKDKVNRAFIVDNAKIEDIMIYFSGEAGK